MSGQDQITAIHCNQNRCFKRTNDMQLRKLIKAIFFVVTPVEKKLIVQPSRGVATDSLNKMQYRKKNILSARK